jgi:hypothetical protein
MQKELILIVLLSLAVFQVHSHNELDKEYNQYRKKCGKTYS